MQNVNLNQKKCECFDWHNLLVGNPEIPANDDHTAPVLYLTEDGKYIFNDSSDFILRKEGESYSLYWVYNDGEHLVGCKIIAWKYLDLMTSELINKFTEGTE